MLERELRKAFEQVTTSNVQGILDFCQATRKMLREIEETVQGLNNTIQTQNQTIEILKMQLASVQAKLYVGGTV